MYPTCRNKIRKAIKNNVFINYDKNFEKKDFFIKHYYETMKRLGAYNYYYFNHKWFTELIRLLKGKVHLFHAYHEGIIIVSALFIEQYPYIHYFLTGSLFDMRHIAATNLLLYEVALWAKKKGLKYFHLGGGYFPNDNLFHFKTSFSACKKDFFIGRVIHHREYYEYMCKLKFQNEIIQDDMFYFPLYRIPNKMNKDEKIYSI